MRKASDRNVGGWFGLGILSMFGVGYVSMFIQFPELADLLWVDIRSAIADAIGSIILYGVGISIIAWVLWQIHNDSGYAEKQRGRRMRHGGQGYGR